MLLRVTPLCRVITFDSTFDESSDESANWKHWYKNIGIFEFIVIRKLIFPCKNFCKAVAKSGHVHGMVANQPTELWLLLPE
jgi:hypothetical protein